MKSKFKIIKLKTLKDMGYKEIFCKKCGKVINGDGWCFTCNDTSNNNVVEKAIRCSELKEEAIKWIKLFDTMDNTFKHFLNITEKDLEDK